MYYRDIFLQKKNAPKGVFLLHLVGSETEDEGQDCVQHGDQLLLVNFFSCILYAASGEILQNSSRQHGEIYAAGLFMPLACGLHIFAKEKRPEGRWHPFGSETEDDGHNRVKHIRVQHGDQLLSVNFFSCILYAASGEILQNSSWQHGEIYAAGGYAVGIHLA